MTDQIEHGPIEALWVGPPSQLIGGGELLPHVTKALVGYHEAHTSENWQPVGEPSVDSLVERARELSIPTPERIKPKAKLQDAIDSAEKALASPNENPEGGDD